MCVCLPERRKFRNMFYSDKEVCNPYMDQKRKKKVGRKPFIKKRARATLI